MRVGRVILCEVNAIVGNYISSFNKGRVLFVFFYSV